MSGSDHPCICICNCNCICMDNEQNFQWSICADRWPSLVAPDFRRSLKASTEGESTSEAFRAFHSLMVCEKMESLYATVLAGMTELMSLMGMCSGIGLGENISCGYSNFLVYCLDHEDECEILVSFSSESYWRSLSICVTLLKVEQSYGRWILLLMAGLDPDLRCLL